MTQQKHEQHATCCLLCTHQVLHLGNVCPRCEPRYISLGKMLITYADQLELMLNASSHKHIGTPMRSVPDVHFLKELDMAVPYEGKMITHRLTVMRLTLDEKHPLQQDHWYSHTIPSTFMAATINVSSKVMGFPEEPNSFVPIASWKPVSHTTHGLPSLDDTKRGGSDGQC